jgi:hypothetical protein
MADTLPFLLVAIIVGASFIAITLLRSAKRPAGADLPPAALEDPRKVREWYRLLHDFDELIVTQTNDINIRPFLPEEMQSTMRQLHKRFRDSI